MIPQQHLGQLAPEFAQQKLGHLITNFNFNSEARIVEVAPAEDIAKKFNEIRSRPNQNGIQNSQVSFFSGTAQDAIVAQHKQGSNAYCVVVNFANEQRIGGLPPIRAHKGQQPGTVYFTQNSSHGTVQEESLMATSTLPLSLMNYEDPDKPGYYGNTMQNFSKNGTTIVSKDLLFGTAQAVCSNSENDRSSQLVCHSLTTRPIAFSTVTSAAPNTKCPWYISLLSAFSLRSPWKTEIERRIKAHVYAACLEAQQRKESRPADRVIFVAGAFGCGAFMTGVKEKKQAKYRKFVAQVYHDLFKPGGLANGFFDEVVMAVPGQDKTPTSNAHIFKEVFGNKPQNIASTVTPVHDKKNRVQRIIDETQKTMREFSQNQACKCNKNYHYDWWLFPISEKDVHQKSSKTTKDFSLSDNDACELLNKPDWFNWYWKNIEDVIKTMRKNTHLLIDHVSPERLYKIITSLNYFERLTNINPEYKQQHEKLYALKQSLKKDVDILNKHQWIQNSKFQHVKKTVTRFLQEIAQPLSQSLARPNHQQTGPRLQEKITASSYVGKPKGVVPPKIKGCFPCLGGR